jgi:hypothetical protein
MSLMAEEDWDHDADEEGEEEEGDEDEDFFMTLRPMREWWGMDGIILREWWAHARRKGQWSLQIPGDASARNRSYYGGC